MRDHDLRGRPGGPLDCWDDVHTPASTPVEDTFAGVATLEGPSGAPLLDGARARFICRNVREIELGDRVIVVDEVERYQTFEGERLVFHSGLYRVVARHPDLDP